MLVAVLNTCTKEELDESEEEEEGRAEKFAEDGDEGVVEPFWDGAVERGETLAKRLGVLEVGGRQSARAPFARWRGSRCRKCETYVFGHFVRCAKRKCCC